MNIVIDASAAVGLVLNLPCTVIFAPLLEEAALVTTPDVFIAEVSNAIWKYRKADLLPMERCELLLEQTVNLPDRIESSAALYQEAFALACRHQHPVYDALYLILARRTNATLLTMDRRLGNLAGTLEIKTLIPPKS